MIDADVIADLRRSFAAALAHEDPVRARTELVAAGWLDALALDEAATVSLVFREQGRLVRDAAALDDVIGARLGLDDLAVAYPALDGVNVVLPAHKDAGRLLWLSTLDAGPLEVIDLDGALDATVVRGIDPAGGLLAVTERPDGSISELDGAAWPPALAAGRVALAHELNALSQSLLELATAYAKDRKQFGVPIAGFQAVKHKLADTLVAIAAADAATIAAATTGTVVSAAVAKALAGAAADVAAKNCLQVFGGIGFTTEHDFHHRFRRSLVLDRLLGDRRSLERELGTRLRTGELRDERIVELDDVPRVSPL